MKLSALTAEDLSAVIDGAPDGMLLVDAEGQIVLANRQADIVFGYEPGMLVGHRVEELMAPELRERHVHHRLGYQAEPGIRAMGARQSLSGVRRDGHTFPVEISLSPMVVAGQSLVVAAVRDVADRRRIEGELAAERQARMVADDRERIAQDLHDTVIQRLFAAGMSLQGVVPRIDDERARTRAEAVVDQLDETIREIRATIFSLQVHGRAGLGGVRGQLLDVVIELSEVLGFEPRLTFDGPVETVGHDVADNLAATLREALTNVAKHASASVVSCTLEVRDDVLLRVADDGVGMPEGGGGRAGGFGLGNMAERASKLGGGYSIRAREGGGTEIVWRVPRG